MATIAVQEITIAGVVPAPEPAAAGGDDFLNSGKEFVQFTNGSGSAITVTLSTQGQLSTGENIEDTFITVIDGQTLLVGPFNQAVYNDASGLLKMTYSDVTNLTVAPLRFEPSTSNRPVVA